MPLTEFHPVIARWFAQRFQNPTRAQTRGWDAIQRGHHTLIAAPTGSGKTLAAFLSAIDELHREGTRRNLPDEVRVVYVSPLKALSTDIHQNLAEPRREIRQLALDLGEEAPKITAAVRTGDTPSSQRAAMVRTPPHILVTTPESLYILLTAERSRNILRTVRTVIVDEIHAVIESRRGAHLALTLERLQHIAGQRLQRIGLSATQRPIETVAQFLIGAEGEDGGGPGCRIIDEGHQRTLDLALEIPDAPLEAVMSGDTWEEIYDRLAQLVAEHDTTLVFANTRRMVERVARHLSDRLGDAAVTAHHGSLSKDVRLDAEERLKTGRLKALVATASLELGIDIGHVDLVCQLGSPRRISTFLQRVGRSGHTIGGTPKGRIFPLSRDDLIECVALIDAATQGALDHLVVFERPLDVLAQQVVAEVACEDWSVDDLYTLVTRSYPYRHLPRPVFDEVIQMTAQGFTTRRGRRGALVHYDGVNKRVRGRRHARLVAMTAGGAIPDNADYRVVEEPAGIFVGTVNEDFAIESMAGDVFQLANTSWRILHVNSGVVRVEDARGVPPNIPFWLGEAPGRSAELSSAVSDLRKAIDARVDDGDAAVDWLASSVSITRPAARQIVHYLDETKKILGVIPTQETIVLERFFDESGGMQLVIHAPFGSRVNRAWGLALRKRFCRQFNFELQAAATEEGLLLSLGPQHSFPLTDVFRYLHPNTVRDILIQALLDAPMFQTRWRWNVTLSLAVPRSNGGRKVPPPLQRMQAEDLLSAVFPDATACLENIGGDREIPQHPLVVQTIDDCLTDAMDIERLRSLLNEILSESIQCVARDTPEPSPLAHEILNAQPYAFLDDAPLEERRAQAVYTRRALEPSSARELGALDAEAIQRVAHEAWPSAKDADELHDALLTAGFVTAREATERGESDWLERFDALRASGRATAITVSNDPPHMLWSATERVAELRSVFPTCKLDPNVQPVQEAPEDRSDAIRSLLRGRLEITGVTTARQLAATLGVDRQDAEMALLALENEGVVLRGTFTTNAGEREWCDRRLLARIHRYTLNRLRAEIEPVSAADFMRFLFAWQHVEPDQRVSGPEGLAGIITQLDGYEVPAGAWEPDVLAARSEEYDPLHLDALCLTGRVAWGRLSPPLRPASGPFSTGPVRATPIALFLRAHAVTWLRLAMTSDEMPLSTYAKETLALLRRRGASFFQELVTDGELLGTQVEQALGELVAHGLVTADSFAGLRALLTPSNRRSPLPGSAARAARGRSPFGVESAGRWSLLQTAAQAAPPPSETDVSDSSVVHEQALTLLRRYGVVFRRLLARETNLAPWRDLVMVYRRLEARGDIRGGRFVAGMSGEQFALPEAVGQLRRIRRSERSGQLLGISAADPLNLVGLVTPGDRIPALTANRIVFRDGVPIAALEAGRLRPLATYDPALHRDIERAAVRRRIPPTLRAYLGKVS